MASLPMVFGPAVGGQMYAATAAKGGGKDEQSLIDWVLGKVAKTDQFYETDPILQGADNEKATSGNGTASSRGGTTGGRKGTTSGNGTASSRGGTTGGRKGTTVSVPAKKKGGNGGGFGGLFAKK